MFVPLQMENTRYKVRFHFFMQVAGYAVGGGHVLHMVCDLTIAADNAVFGQTGPKVLLLAIIIHIILFPKHQTGH